MADLDNTSDIAAIIAVYLDNIYYRREGSVSMAREFEAACMAYIAVAPKRAAQRKWRHPCKQHLPTTSRWRSPRKYGAAV